MNSCIIINFFFLKEGERGKIKAYKNYINNKRKILFLKFARQVNEE